MALTTKIQYLVKVPQIFIFTKMSNSSENCSFSKCKSIWSEGLPITCISFQYVEPHIHNFYMLPRCDVLVRLTFNFSKRHPITKCREGYLHLREMKVIRRMEEIA
jgi:hypothetical protein